MFGMSHPIVRSFATVVAAAASAVLFAAAAQAMDKGDCDRLFAAANVQRTDQFSLNRDGADFGDELHLGGAPLGTAVVCWSIDGRAAVRGRLYAHGRDATEAIVEIRFRRTNGRFTNITRRSVSTQGGLFPAGLTVEKVSPVGNFNRVRVQLFVFRAPALAVPARRVLVATQNFNR